MHPSEPEDAETSLELTFDEAKLPAQPAEPDGPPAPAPGPLGNLVVAHFRRVEIAMLGRVLVTTLSGALPPSMVRVEYRRSLGRRLTGRTGEPIGVSVTSGDRVLTFRTPEVGVVETTVGHVVRGVVLSTETVPVGRWLDELGAVLTRATEDDEAARTALERALLT